jgi:hypothetical protein
MGYLIDFYAAVNMWHYTGRFITPRQTGAAWIARGRLGIGFSFGIPGLASTRRSLQRANCKFFIVRGKNA